MILKCGWVHEKLLEGNEMMPGGTTTIREDASRLMMMADMFAQRADQVIAERDNAQILAMSHAELCAKMVHVDSVEKAVDLLVQTALQVDHVDSVSVWVERKGAIKHEASVGIFSGLGFSEKPKKEAGCFDLRELTERRVQEFPQLSNYFPVPIYHPGNGPIGVVEYGTTAESDFPQVTRRVLCGITDTVATVIGRLTLFEMVDQMNDRFFALSRASSQGIAVIFEEEVFASNEVFDLIVSAGESSPKKEAIEQVVEIAKKGSGFEGKVSILGSVFYAKVGSISLRKGGEAEAVVLTLWKDRQ